MLLAGRARTSCWERHYRMTPISMAALALAMSTDAFAAAVGKGAALQRPRWAEALRTGLI
jgi:putative Mn2+ efflux pump MntP